MTQNNEIINLMCNEMALLIEELGGYVEPYYISSNKLNGDLTAVMTSSYISVEENPVYFYFSLRLPRFAQFFFFEIKTYPLDSEMTDLFVKAFFRFSERKRTQEYRSLFLRVFNEFIEHMRLRVRILNFFKRNESKIQLKFDSTEHMANIKKLKLTITIKNKPEAEIFSSKYYNKEIINNIIKFSKKHNLDYSDL